ncbi:MAG: hypothetical protein CSB46_03540 [Micrococcales bacterium]|nr:MAG: hypothetical protein CSB46_03540 [Micrococcales bacterium]
MGKTAGGRGRGGGLHSGRRGVDAFRDHDPCRCGRTARLSGVVRIGLDDPSDPTPYWLVSSRNPQALAAAVNEAVAARR